MTPNAPPSLAAPVPMPLWASPRTLDSHTPLLFWSDKCRLSVVSRFRLRMFVGMYIHAYIHTYPFIRMEVMHVVCLSIWLHLRNDFCAWSIVRFLGVASFLDSIFCGLWHSKKIGIIGIALEKIGKIYTFIQTYIFMQTIAILGGCCCCSSYIMTHVCCWSNRKTEQQTNIKKGNVRQKRKVQLT